MSFLDRIQACNRCDLSGFIPFVADQQTIGWVRPHFAEHLAKADQVFMVTDESVSFSDALETPAARSAAIAAIAPDWVGSGLVAKLRKEIYPARKTWSGTDHFQLDRALAPLFGVRAYGVHLNGYVEKHDGIHLWIGRRSADRRVEPDKLDNMVAGGQPANLGLMENLIKECAEEADVPSPLAATATPVGTVSYCFETEAGLKPDTLFCYDLVVPEDFEPRNQDGEIADFRLMPIQEALSLIQTGDAFKFNVSLVILDFAIRHGVLSPDTEPDYEAILGGLHRVSPLPGTTQ
ncbi:MAG: DUF4743 domain-containing protein [Rhodospirillaceae bacterium]|nr:DUF4743 domain-containing protein [Rhodospirillaceae bacterium]MBT5241112.1 DUF4743 domain-containing protein [Rhodospirillaceae bacterium]MBT5565624.1 DUF4743 domain-containing protein [Rhodospirillaceae bacterium]MBT6090830.1 DUF4743 domain-containing protein [Rhodospirillaceae bacterium]MBT6961143.1 DUF4743 domain-containing protein [Rhodospirillaceae bacterium]